MTAADQIPTRYAFLVERIHTTVDRLNRELLGVEVGDWETPKITFGYIGNCSGHRPDGTWSHDDRSWSVFLPHPGRVGTDADRIGQFRTGDEMGAAAVLNALAGFERGARFARGDVMAEADYRRAARHVTD